MSGDSGNGPSRRDEELGGFPFGDLSEAVRRGAVVDGGRVGYRPDRYAARTSWLTRVVADIVVAMAEERPMFDARPGSQGEAMGRTDRVLTAADHAALVAELELLQARHRREVEEGLRLARGFSGSPDSDDLLAVLEDAAIDQARIAQLEEVVRTASVVDGPAMSDGTAGLGTVVRVIDDGGRTSEYELVGRRTPDSQRHAVSLSSPVGKALVGARRGDVVQAELPSGRRRALRVLDVEPCQPAETSSSAARMAEAA